MPKANILFAEDDPILQSIYMKKFSLAGYGVRGASNGEEAIAALNESAPDLLILDINMPKVDGFQVLEKFPKASRKYPIILLTNYDSDEVRKRGEELGADDFFVKKDMTIRSLITMAENLLSKTGAAPGSTEPVTA